MALTYKTGVDCASQVKAQGKNTGLTVTSTTGKVFSTDVNGELTFPNMDNDSVNYIISEIPLSQFGELYSYADLDIKYSGFVVSFNREIPLFMAGMFYMIPTQQITVIPQEDTKNHGVYVTLVDGKPQYEIHELPQPETVTNMYIGFVTVQADRIIGTDIKTISRFSLYRASETQKGSSFPVSSGDPSLPGRVYW